MTDRIGVQAIESNELWTLVERVTILDIGASETRRRKWVPKEFLIPRPKYGAIWFWIDSNDFEGGMTPPPIGLQELFGEHFPVVNWDCFEQELNNVNLWTAQDCLDYWLAVEAVLRRHLLRCDVMTILNGISAKHGGDFFAVREEAEDWYGDWLHIARS